MSNRNNSRHKNQALSVWQANLPEVSQKELDLIDRSRSRIESAVLCHRVAASAISDNHVYSLLQQLSTIEKGEVLKQTYPRALTPEVEALLTRLTEKYLATMEMLDQQAAGEVFAELMRFLKDLNNLDDRSIWNRLQKVLDHEYTIRFRL